MRLLLYIFLYINADSILNKLYLSNNICSNNELITYNNEFYYAISILNGFTLMIYTIYIICRPFATIKICLGPQAPVLTPTVFLYLLTFLRNR